MRAGPETVTSRATPRWIGMRLGRGSVRTRISLVAAAGAAALTAAVVLPADAATPTEGTVTDTATSTTWSAGPFAAPNVSAQAGDPVCGSPQLCDDYTLHVSTPPGYGDGHQLAISVSWANTAADFDVYVLNAAGDVVGTAATSADPEQVVLPPDTGDYTVRVVPFAPLGESVTGTAQLTTPPANPAPATFPAPAYANYAAPETLADAHNAGEPSIGVDPTTGAVMYQAYTSTYRVNFGSSATWLDKSANATN